MNAGNIFIFGVPRSGTTWLAKIFDSHPGTLLRHEPDTVNPTAAIPFIMSEQEIDQYLTEARDYLHERTTDTQLRCVSSSPYFRKSFRTALTDKIRQGTIAGCRLLDVASGGRLDRKLKVGDMVSAGETPINVVKSVDSCGRLPLFAKACPMDKFILIVRHPCGVIASKFRGREIGKMDPAVTFRKLLDLDGTGQFNLTLEDLENWSTLEADAWGWMLTHDFILKAAGHLPNLLVVNYDELCEAPLDRARSMLEWAGLPWQAQTEGYISECISQAPDARTGFYSTQQNPSQAANKWKSQLDAAQIDQIMEICRKSEAGHMFEV